MQQTFLAIDDISLPLRKNVCLYLSKPEVRKEPVLTPSPMESTAPDNQAAHFYGTVLHDEGKFRMWYYAQHAGRNPDWPERGSSVPKLGEARCLARSSGVRWRYDARYDDDTDPWSLFGGHSTYLRLVEGRR